MTRAAHAHILFVDDEASMRTTVSHLLRREGLVCDTAGTENEAKSRLADTAYDIVVTDIRMKGFTGLDLLRHLQTSGIDVPVVILTAFASLEVAIEALQIGGARDLVPKGSGWEQLLLARIRTLIRERQLEAENASLREALGTRYGFEEIVGRSDAMQDVLEMVRRVAATSSTILVHGESGTGKELIARAIHANSPRREGDFVSVNCGAMPDNLLESELFGHVKGAFTGAVQAKLGLFEVADGGTILLDEIGETSSAMQVKLLRVLQERRIRRVGGTEEIAVDARVVAATNRDLEAMVREGRFREDLFYRINVIPIHVPPLRMRPGDISLLAEYFLTRFRESMGKPIGRISDEAMELLSRYRWPGNVRELENVIERAVALELSPVITPESLPRELRLAGESHAPEEEPELPVGEFDLEVHLEGRREAFMRAALARANGVQSHAAKALGMSFRSFRYFARKYGLTGGREPSSETAGE
ncbi:MAG: sigma-54 dependent transcriptional regulator [Acidobacteriota bacterium]|jgi:two-component system response regulator PilR (NtrC family)